MSTIYRNKTARQVRDIFRLHHVKQTSVDYFGEALAPKVVAGDLKYTITTPDHRIITTKANRGFRVRVFTR